MTAGEVRSPDSVVCPNRYAVLAVGDERLFTPTVVRKSAEDAEKTVFAVPLARVLCSR
jgi:hypothetical protein